MHPLLDAIERHAVDRPGKLAAADQSLVLNYAEFRAVACGLANRLEALSERANVGLLIPTSAACAAAIYACWYAGRVPVPLNFLLTPRELAKIVRDADLDVVATIEPFAPALEGTGVRTLILSGGSTMAPERRTPPSAAPDDLAAVIYTSGTAGDSKGAELTVSNLIENVRSAIAAIHLREDEVFLGLIPQFHGFGFTATTLIPLTLGATVHYLPRFTPLTVGDVCRERGVTVFITVASMFGALLQSKSLTAADFAALRYPISGGEALPPRVARAFEARFGKRMFEGYGMTEASPIVSVNTPDVYRFGSVGRPLPGISVAAVDGAGRALPPGAEGELAIRGHCVMRGYRNKPDLTAGAIRDGALFTGDIGRVDGDGFVHITGRAKEIIIVGGENVYPSEVERVLAEHPAVLEAAVVGGRDELRGEMVVGYVVPVSDAAPPTETELREYCRDKLASYKIPRSIHVRADLPRGPTGKILKRALAST